MSAALIQFPHRSTGERPRLWKWVGAVLLGIAAWRRRARSRRELISADRRMLADLGISHAQAGFMAIESRFNCNAPVDRGGDRPPGLVQ
ncbi:MAG: DUF1127 domain-containing protein [Acetobacteraceae bacterium]